MIRVAFILIFGFSTMLSFGQTKDSVKIKYGTFTTYDELRQRQDSIGGGPVTYLDSEFNYEVKIPNWLNLKDGGSRYIFGGTLPAVDSIENAIAIKSFPKKFFTSFSGFKAYVVDSLVFQQMPPWSNTDLFWGKKILPDYNDIGSAYIVYLKEGPLMYFCEYVLIETKTAYLWIDYHATATTFDKNMDKFKEFMSGFKTTDLKYK